MESPFFDIDYERENNISHTYYMKGYQKGLEDGGQNLIKFFCNLSNEEILNWIDFYRDSYKKENEIKTTCKIDGLISAIKKVISQYENT